jgi:hypothetical protein
MTGHQNADEPAERGEDACYSCLRQRKVETRGGYSRERTQRAEEGDNRASL